jgi:hypothetical protein
MVTSALSFAMPWMPVVLTLPPAARAARLKQEREKCDELINEAGLADKLQAALSTLTPVEPSAPGYGSHGNAGWTS